MKTLLLIQALLQCPSITPQPLGTFEVIEAFLKPLGFHVEKVTFGDVTNLYAKRGSGKPHLCFAGHVDVVPPGDTAAWSVPPFEGVIKDGQLWGRGVADMKGAIGCFLGATKKFLEESPHASGTISFLLTSDEEGPAINGTQKMIPWLQERQEIPDVCLIGEPTGLGKVGDILKVGRRGSVTGILRVLGKQGHIAYPHLADNPIPRLMRCLQSLMRMPLDGGTDVFEPSRLEVTSIDVGNPTSNIIPRIAEARFGLRFNTLQRGDDLAEKIRALCAEQAEKHELSVTVHGEAFLTTDQGWIQKFSQALQKITGREPRLDTTGGTTDGRFLSAICPVLECGLSEATIHQVDEHVRLEDIHQLEAIYLSILKILML